MKNLEYVTSEQAGCLHELLQAWIDAVDNTKANISIEFSTGGCGVMINARRVDMEMPEQYYEFLLLKEVGDVNDDLVDLVQKKFKLTYQEVDL